MSAPLTMLGEASGPPGPTADLLVMTSLQIGACSRQQAEEQHRYEVGKGSVPGPTEAAPPATKARPTPLAGEVDVPHWNGSLKACAPTASAHTRSPGFSGRRMNGGRITVVVVQ
jgi:hypothetical protein